MTENTENLVKTEEQNEGKLSFTLEIYEGPLDLLLALIAKNKINIYDIPISLIFEQYMEYIEKLKDTSDHWACLYAHSLLAPIFADIYIARYSGDEEKVKTNGELLKTKLKELQPIIEPVCDDVTLTFDWLTKYLSRHTPEPITRN